MKTRNLIVLLPFFLGLVFAGPASGMAVSNVDTLPLREVIRTNNLELVSKMSDEQLVVLIDLLFELDSIPVDLAAEIGRTVKSRRSSDPAPLTVVKPVSLQLYESSTPASEYYTVFDSKHLVPIEDSWKKSDTGFVINMYPEGHEEFFMPTCAIVSSPFGWRGDTAMHNGIDLDLNRGDPVVAAWDGIVRMCGRHGNYGNLVVVRHYNGLETVYAHLHKIRVKVGMQVKAGQAVGLGGSTGRSTGSHLHFEVRFKGQPINPKYFISFRSEKPIGMYMVIRKTRNGMCAYPLGVEYHTAEKGDNIFEIAKRYGKTVKDIKELNGMSGKSYKIKPGMKVRVS
ncbi:MAG: peptidoglycan DD-metalloendopeptidase family protein [Bacteroidia bacterium]|nr:peptidoglycan DD-metalloendopeptidase family protein [Bacteroidia bacterium]